MDKNGWTSRQVSWFQDSWHKVFNHGIMYGDTVSATIQPVQDDTGEWVWELSAYYHGHYRQDDMVRVLHAPHHLPRYRAIQLEALMKLAEQKWGTVAESAPLPEGVEIA